MRVKSSGSIVLTDNSGLSARWKKSLMECGSSLFIDLLCAHESSCARIRERIKDVLLQYELRERHFECVIRSKELEVLLSRARWAEQKQLADGEKSRADKVEEEVSICTIC